MTAPTKKQRKIARAVPWGEEGMKSLQTFQDAIAKNLGYLGVPGVQIGSRVIKAKAPSTLAECVGAGDTIRVGDVVIDLSRSHDDYPHRIEAIFPSEEPGLLGPSILSREIDASDPKVSRKGPTSYLAWGSGWRRNFKVLTQVDVTTWWLKAKKDRADGWHKLPEWTGRVLIDTGVPIEIERATASPYHNIKYVVAVAEQMLGFDITPCRIYTNSSKLNMRSSGLCDETRLKSSSTESCKSLLFVRYQDEENKSLLARKHQGWPSKVGERETGGSSPRRGTRRMTVEIREHDDVWAPINAVVVREDDPREITIQLRASFHGINADYDSGSKLTLNRCDLRGWEKHRRD